MRKAAWFLIGVAGLMSFIATLSTFLDSGWINHQINLIYSLATGNPPGLESASPWTRDQLGAVLTASRIVWAAALFLFVASIGRRLVHNSRPSGLAVIVSIAWLIFAVSPMTNSLSHDGYPYSNFFLPLINSLIWLIISRAFGDWPFVRTSTHSQTPPQKQIQGN